MVVVHLWLQDNVRITGYVLEQAASPDAGGKSYRPAQGVKGPFINSDFGDTESVIIALRDDDAGYIQMRLSFAA